MATNLEKRYYARQLTGHAVDRSVSEYRDGQPTVNCPHPEHDAWADRILRPGNRVHVIAVKRDDEWELERIQCLSCDPPYGTDSVPEALESLDGAILADATLACSAEDLVLSEVHAYDGTLSESSSG